MERRRHPRRVAEIEIKVTDINAAESHEGRVCDVSRAGLCVVLARTIPVGTPLRLEAADSVLYGFVTYASGEGMAIRTGIELQQVLMGATDLSRLLENSIRAFLPNISGLSSPEVYLG